MKFSIIVPVFNSELYIEECVNSVLGQTYEDFELILVDDGSTDKSGLICDWYAQNDNRVRTFHEINSGVSAARNKGLENVTGEWILFLDSDDVLHLNALKCLSENIANCPQVDVFQFGFTNERFSDLCVHHDGKYIPKTSPQEYCALGLYNVCAAGSVIKIKLINEHYLRFDCQLKLAEDQVFIFQVLHNATLCSRLSDVLYYYRDTPYSATKSANLENMTKTIRALELYKQDMPLAIEQFDCVIMSFIYYMTLDRNISINVIVDLFNKVNINYVHRCTRGAQLLFYLSKISKKLALIIIRRLKYQLI